MDYTDRVKWFGMYANEIENREETETQYMVGSQHYFKTNLVQPTTTTILVMASQEKCTSALVL